MEPKSQWAAQDFRAFLADYRRAWPDDVLTFESAVSSDQDITAVIWRLADGDLAPMLHFKQVEGLDVEVAANVFASRARIARILGATPEKLHEAYQARSSAAKGQRVAAQGPILGEVETVRIELGRLPMLRHFETDRARYITSGIIVAEHPETAAGNLSYHRAMIHSANELATSLHSRGHLWRLLNMAQARGAPLPVAMVIGAHPAFMLAASARVGFGEDERDIAGGLLGEPLEVVRTPKYGLRVPAYAEYVLEGIIDPATRVEEGPFGEFTGYSSDRSTNNLFRVETILRRKDAILVSVAGGRSADHLNLARVPREAEMVEKIKQRFPSVTALHYPNSGAHFHAYVAMTPARAGEARQVLLALLGWDPYLKTAVAVDSDIDVTQDSQVLWALAVHFQPHRDAIIVDGLPGNALDPSASNVGATSRMGLDATRGPDFHGVRAKVSEAALQRADVALATLGR